LLKGRGSIDHRRAAETVTDGFVSRCTGNRGRPVRAAIASRPDRRAGRNRLPAIDKPVGNGLIDRAVSGWEGDLAKFRIATPAGASFSVAGGGYGYELEALTPIDAEIYEIPARSEDEFVAAAKDADALYAKGRPITA
jgi:hypothetical protein